MQLETRAAQRPREGVESRSPVAVEFGAAEPTLPVTLSGQVQAALPGRLAQLLHLAFPLAVQFVVIGWWRSAAWALAIGAFGSWGLADRWLASAAAAHSRRRAWVRAAGVAAATIASVVPLVLLLELFLRVMGAAPTF